MTKLTKDVLYNVLDIIIDIGLVHETIEELDVEPSFKVKQELEKDITEYIWSLMKGLQNEK